MLLDEILDLEDQTKDGQKIKLRDRIAAVLNYQLKIGDFDSSFLFAGILLFKCKGFPVTNKTEDLIKCLMVEYIQFPPYKENRLKKPKTIYEFLDLVCERINQPSV